jgi:hypothetical protein
VSYPYSGSQTEDKTAMYHLVRNDVAGVSPGISQARSEFTKINLNGTITDIYAKPAFLETGGTGGTYFPFQGTLCDIRENNTYLLVCVYCIPEVYDRSGTDDGTICDIRSSFQFFDAGLNNYMNIDGTIASSTSYISTDPSGYKVHTYSYNSASVSYHNTTSTLNTKINYIRIVKDGSTGSFGYLGTFGFIPTYKVSSDIKWVHSALITLSTSTAWSAKVDFVLLKSFVAIIDPSLAEDNLTPQPLGRTLQYMDGGPASKYQGVKYRKTFYLPPYIGYTVKAYIQNKNKIDGLPVKTNIVLSDSNSYFLKAYNQVTPGPWREV